VLGEHFVEWIVFKFILALNHLLLIFLFVDLRLGLFLQLFLLLAFLLRDVLIVWLGFATSFLLDWLIGLLFTSAALLCLHVVGIVFLSVIVATRAILRSPLVVGVRWNWLFYLVGLPDEDFSIHILERGEDFGRASWLVLSGEKELECGVD
jgi:hypothetical protein